MTFAFPRRGAVKALPGDRGSAAVEFVGFLPILLVVGLAAIQLGIAAYAAQQAGSAARAAARTATLDHTTISPQSAGRAAVSGWIADRAAFDVSGCGTEAQVTVTVRIPAIIPLFTVGSARRTATMPCPAVTALGSTP